MENSRAIAPHEAGILRWLLDRALTQHGANYRGFPIEALRVVGSCTCGCASLDFAPPVRGPKTIVADAYAVYPDGQMAGIILWGHEGEIVSLEVYDCHPVASRRCRSLCICGPLMRSEPQTARP
jgi:hypothetical protein